MDLTSIPDYIVIGSGNTGAMAAQSLVEGGASVTMLDVGRVDRTYAPLIPDADFVTLRSTDDDQHRYLLGDEFEGLPSTSVTTGAPMTPPRAHVTELVERLLPILSETFKPLESLGYGGLGSAWGAGACVYSDAELDEAGLDRDAMRAAYQVVADRIGISGNQDDATRYTSADLDGVQPAPVMDETCSRLFRSYTKKRSSLLQRGFRMGRPALALITEDLGDRRGYRGRDMDFYDDRDRSVYRPWITVDRLRTDSRFRYEPGRLAVRFEEHEDAVTVHCLDVETGAPLEYRARRLVLAGGTLGTARIVLRSQGRRSQRMPLLCNPYAYVPCIQPSMLGKAISPRRMSLAQLSLFHDPDRTNMDVAMGSIYSYGSLMLFRIILQAPIDMADARVLMQYLLPTFTIVGIHHPERPRPGRWLALESDASSPTGDRLRAEYQLSADERTALKARERTITGALRSLGAWAIKRIDPGMGSSVHYAGTMPFATDGRPFSVHPGGLLAGTSRVWVGDGSGFRYLPAKGLTLSLMANAHLVAREALRG